MKRVGKRGQGIGREETDGGDGRETGSVMEGDGEKKIDDWYQSQPHPDFRDKERKKFS